ncbi:amidase family protein [uncultured Rhodoblastus sp.]|uniref:amidase family protein n=1 Tax=uncultured Rhodoblastus sp. TaxID=543037 RepID=UPI0025E0516D|nr:amidase family protein [uncultured Rhodoblastus sp.]
MSEPTRKAGFKAFDEEFFAASAIDWRHGLGQRKFSARELLDAVWERILQRNPAINALAAYDFEAAMRAAAVADARFDRGEARALEGLPITVKDSFETQGLTTSCGAMELADHRPRSDALAVARLRAAGAIVLAKSNVPRLTGDFQTYSELYGVSANPFDLSRSPGGSSGGAAASAASGFCAFELASDLGGSIRWPAHACGLFGLKTSWGQIPLFGHIPPLPAMRLKNPPDLAVAGPLARSSGDLDLVLSVAAGPLNAQGPAFLRKARKTRPEDLRLALWLEPGFAPVDAAVAYGVLMAAEALRKAGARVDVAARPAFSFREAFEIYAFLNFAIGFAGTPAEAREEIAACGKFFDADDPSYPAMQARAARLDAAVFSRMMERRTAIDKAFAAFFAEYDAILCPPAPCAAIRHDFTPDFFARRLETSAGALPYYDLLKWASLASLARLPAAVAPVGRDASGLPCGVQILCAFDEDRSAVAIAALLEKELGGFCAPPSP